VAQFVNTFFEERLERLFDLADIVEEMFSSAGLDYRVAGGLATYLYVEEAAPDAGRLTKDIDVVVRRSDIERIARAAEPFGFQHRHVAGVDMLVSAVEPSARRAVHLVFAGEKVRPEYAEPAPQIGPARTVRGLRLIPLVDLVRMKLTSFRAIDAAHVLDLDRVGLITPEVEQGLSAALCERLAEARARG